ncbi:MAG TPA: methylated-DNA--[protein]-cysteine S-methyltransferase [Micromonosporaceae bacterium]|jgi:methylated-DNA-[protein]-cysteine S-methyltransferase|nr:methylated-DNA--[protein]-cysteine S-methyltransferase [Micromonosporaceae bacterium]
MTSYTTIDSPIGELLVVADSAVTRVSILDRPGAAAIEPGWRPDPARFADIERQLRAYFAGDLTEFDVAFETRGTPFQERVWAALDAIPYGTTTTYGRIAAAIGAPRDRIRAVGAAIGANPLLIVRPCHRVVGANGALTGYAGGVERKQFLLTHEGALQAQLV